MRFTIYESIWNSCTPRKSDIANRKNEPHIGCHFFDRLLTLRSLVVWLFILPGAVMDELHLFQRHQAAAHHLVKQFVHGPTTVSGFYNQHATVGMVADAVGGVAEQAAP